MLEVIRLEGYPLSHEDAFMSRDIHLLQVLQYAYDYMAHYFRHPCRVYWDWHMLYCSYVAESMRMLWEPALNLFSLQSMKCFLMMLPCYRLVFALFLLIQNQLSYTFLFSASWYCWIKFITAVRFASRVLARPNVADWSIFMLRFTYYLVILIGDVLLVKYL